MEESPKQELLLLFGNAAISGNVDQVRQLVQIEGLDPSTAINSMTGKTALHVATENGDLELARYLIEEAHCDVDREDNHGRTALHQALCLSELFMSRRLSMVRYLVETGGANIEARQYLGKTPLHSASYAGHAAIVEYLVEERQANVHAKDGRGRSPLDHAMLCRVCYTNEDVIRFLLPRTSSVAKETLLSSWRDDNASDRKKELRVEIRRAVLGKYANGSGLAKDFNRFPIHTMISCFPLPSTEAFQECFMLFPTSSLSLLDEQGKLPIHLALRSINRALVACSVSAIISFLFDLEPRSALARDPSTGLYPHETLAGLVVSGAYVEDDNSCLLDVLYKMFRSNPKQFLETRRGHAGNESTSSSVDGMQ